MSRALSIQAHVIEEIGAYLLAQHVGRPRAVTAEDLALRFGLGDRRRAKEVVSDLRRRGYPIGSGAGGYFRLATREEFEATDRFLGEQIKSLAVCRAALREAAARDGVLGWEAPVLPGLAEILAPKRAAA